jgi:c(7)-type cytochrome triheme protein
MKHTLVLAMAISTICMAGPNDGQKAFPVRFVIPATYGGVTFNHFKHAEREKFDCGVCHRTQWPQNAKAALNYKEAEHQSSDSAKHACGACHRTGGKAFATSGNCGIRCHQEYAGGLDRGRVVTAVRLGH